MWYSIQQTYIKENNKNDSAYRNIWRKTVAEIPQQNASGSLWSKTFEKKYNERVNQQTAITEEPNLGMSEVGTGNEELES